MSSNTVYIGKKPVMNYVLACLTLFQNGANEVTIKARGRSISTAVDSAEILRKKFSPDVQVKEIKIDTEQVKDNETGSSSNVSSIEIMLKK
ncbi:MAG: DNA-binding protein Alba [Nitrososphaerota archaeon]|jgi:DNA-binding protein|nr:DNA-binding protein Alba [Nitrososphaerota archaeon]